MKVALVVGHRKSDKGAANAAFGLTEWDLNNILVAIIKAKLTDYPNIEPVVIHRDDDSNGYAKLPEKINKENPDYVIEFHCNSAGNNSSKGSEVLYWHSSTRGKEFANKMNKEMFKALGVHDRGLKGIDNLDDVTGEAIKERGWVVLKKTKAPAIILEPAFFSNLSDTINLLKRFGSLADAVTKVLVDMA